MILLQAAIGLGIFIFQVMGILAIAIIPLTMIITGKTALKRRNSSGINISDNEYLKIGIRSLFKSIALVIIIFILFVVLLLSTIDLSIS